MEGMLLAGFLAFLFVSITAILFFGYKGIEEERAKKALDSVEGWPDDLYVARFLSKSPKAEQDRVPEAQREAVRLRVQVHLDSEQRMVDEFVSQPSVENLYRRSGSK